MRVKKSLIGISMFLLIIGGLFYMMNLYTPMCGDDYLYSFYMTPEVAKSFLGGTSLVFDQKILSVTDIFCSQYNHYFYVNGRTVPHILEQLFAGLLPENCFNWINVFFFLLFNTLVVCITDKSKLSNFGYWVLVISFTWFLLPCPVDIYLIMSGAFNYLWSAVFCLGFLLVYNRTKQLESVNWLTAIALFLFGLLSGWTHEALVVGVSGALFLICFLQYRKKPRLSQSMLVVGFWLGTLLLCLSPAARGRASFDHPSVWDTFLMVAVELRAFYVLMLLMICTILREKKNGNSHSLIKFVHDNQLYFYVILIELAFSFFIGFRSVRQLLGIELFAIVLSLKLISKMVSFHSVWFKNISVIVAGAILLFMVSIIPCAKRTYVQFQGIVTSYLQSEDGIISFKHEEIPSMIDSYVWKFGVYLDWEAYCISVYYTGNKKPMKVMQND